MTKNSYLLDKRLHTIEVERGEDRVKLSLDGETKRVQVLAIVPPRITFLLDGKIVTAHVAQASETRWVHVDGAAVVLERSDNTRRGKGHGAREGSGSGLVVAPMPGQVRAVLVQVGTTVTEGQPLLLLEAMKMELKVSAPRDGVVEKIMVTQGQSVEREQVLAEIVRGDVA